MTGQWFKRWCSVITATNITTLTTPSWWQCPASGAWWFSTATLYLASKEEGHWAKQRLQKESEKRDEDKLIPKGGHTSGKRRDAKWYAHRPCQWNAQKAVSWSKGPSVTTPWTVTIICWDWATICSSSPCEQPSLGDGGWDELITGESVWQCIQHCRDFFSPANSCNLEDKIRQRSVRGWEDPIPTRKGWLWTICYCICHRILLR